MRCDIAFFIWGAEMPAAAHSCVEAAVPLLVDLTAVAQMLPRAGSSRVLERFGGANFTVLRMGGVPDPDESHGHPEVCGRSLASSDCASANASIAAGQA